MVAEIVFFLNDILVFLSKLQQLEDSLTSAFCSVIHQTLDSLTITSNWTDSLSFLISISKDWLFLLYQQFHTDNRWHAVSPAYTIKYHFPLR